MKLQFIIVLFLVLITSFIYADEEDSLLVEYYACFTTRDDIETEIAKFLKKTQQYLSEKNLNVGFESHELLSCEYNLPFADARLIFGERTNNKIIDIGVNISLSPNNLQNISPLLKNERALSLYSIHENSAPELLATLLLYYAGEVDIAEENLLMFRNEIEQKRTLHDINYFLGNIALINGNYDLAIEHYNNYEWEYLPFYSTNLAWTLLQIGESEQAISHLTEVINLYNGLPPYLIWLIDRAHIYALAFDYTSAIDDMDTAIQFIDSNEFDEELYLSNYIQPDGIDGLKSTLYKQRGDIIMLIYEWNRALEDYNTAIELNPDYAEAYYRRGILLYTMVERKNAVADFETYLELDPDGQFSESAREYMENIQIELDALGG